jgi:SET domain-containing protein
MTKAKQEVLNILKNTYCRLKSSKISGVGVFAVRNIPKGINPFRGQIDQKWHKFKMSELKKLDSEILKMIDDFFVIELDGTLTIPKSGLNGMDMSFYVNHSAKPNVKTIDNGFTFVSLRKIKKGEEITVAYDTYDDKFKK